MKIQPIFCFWQEKFLALILFWKFWNSKKFISCLPRSSHDVEKFQRWSPQPCWLSRDPIFTQKELLRFNNFLFLKKIIGKQICDYLTLFITIPVNLIVYAQHIPSLVWYGHMVAFVSFFFFFLEKSDFLIIK